MLPSLPGLPAAAAAVSTAATTTTTLSTTTAAAAAATAAAINALQAEPRIDRKILKATNLNATKPRFELIRNNRNIGPRLNNRAFFVRYNVPSDLGTGVVLTGGLTVMTAGLLLKLAAARYGRTSYVLQIIYVTISSSTPVLGKCWTVQTARPVAGAEGGGFLLLR